MKPYAIPTLISDSSFLQMQTQQGNSENQTTWLAAIQVEGLLRFQFLLWPGLMLANEIV